MSFTILSSLRWIPRVQTVVSGLLRIGSHSYYSDVHGKLVWMELNTFELWLVRPAMGPSFGWSCSTFPLLQLARQPIGTCLDHQAPPLDSVLTVCLIDQYLDRRPVPRRHLQLVEVAASLIAAKFEEIPSKVQVFVYITADAYLIQKEIWILAPLELRISTSTAAHFLELVG